MIEQSNQSKADMRMERINQAEAAERQRRILELNEVFIQENRKNFKKRANDFAKVGSTLSKDFSRLGPVVQDEIGKLRDISDKAQIADGRQRKEMLLQSKNSIAVLKTMRKQDGANVVAIDEILESANQQQSLLKKNNFLVESSKAALGGLLSDTAAVALGVLSESPLLSMATSKIGDVFKGFKERKKDRSEALLDAMVKQREGLDVFSESQSKLGEVMEEGLGLSLGPEQVDAMAIGFQEAFEEAGLDLSEEEFSDAVSQFDGAVELLSAAAKMAKPAGEESQTSKSAAAKMANPAGGESQTSKDETLKVEIMDGPSQKAAAKALEETAKSQELQTGGVISKLEMMAKNGKRQKQLAYLNLQAVRAGLVGTLKWIGKLTPDLTGWLTKWSAKNQNAKLNVLVEGVQAAIKKQSQLSLHGTEAVTNSLGDLITVGEGFEIGESIQFFGKMLGYLPDIYRPVEDILGLMKLSGSRADEALRFLQRDDSRAEEGQKLLQLEDRRAERKLGASEEERREALEMHNDLLDVLSKSASGSVANASEKLNKSGMDLSDLGNIADVASAGILSSFLIPKGARTFVGRLIGIAGLAYEIESIYRHGMEEYDKSGEMGKAIVMGFGGLGEQLLDLIEKSGGPTKAVRDEWSGKIGMAMEDWYIKTSKSMEDFLLSTIPLPVQAALKIGRFTPADATSQEHAEKLIGAGTPVATLSDTGRGADIDMKALESNFSTGQLEDLLREGTIPTLTQAGWPFYSEKILPFGITKAQKEAIQAILDIRKNFDMEVSEGNGRQAKRQTDFFFDQLGQVLFTADPTTGSILADFGQSNRKLSQLDATGSTLADFGQSNRKLSQLDAAANLPPATPDKTSTVSSGPATANVNIANAPNNSTTNTIYSTGVPWDTSRSLGVLEFASVVH